MLKSEFRVAMRHNFVKLQNEPLIKTIMFQTSDFRLQTSDFRLQASDFALQVTTPQERSGIIDKIPLLFAPVYVHT